MQAKKFPHSKNAVRQIVTLFPGDCIFIPAYYFYQLHATSVDSKVDEALNDFSLPQRQTEYHHTLTTLVSLQFQANSKLLQGFMDAVEKGVLK